ncbi:PilC/PilY family type IV pilus protein [Comamonadaceae bacterium PP-2]
MIGPAIPPRPASRDVRPQGHGAVVRRATRPIAVRYGQGSALIPVTLVLALAGWLGLAALQANSLARHGPSQLHDGQVASEAAAAALADGLRDIDQGVKAHRMKAQGQGTAPPPGSGTERPDAAFSDGPSPWFTAGCGHTTQDRGLCVPATEGQPVWQQVDWQDRSADSRTVELGRYTGVAFAPAHPSTLPAEPPRYIIESLADTLAAEPAGARRLYRVTALGYGLNAGTRAMQQALYRPAPPGDESTLGSSVSGHVYRLRRDAQTGSTDLVARGLDRVPATDPTPLASVLFGTVAWSAAERLALRAEGDRNRVIGERDAGTAFSARNLATGDAMASLTQLATAGQSSGQGSSSGVFGDPVRQEPIRHGTDALALRDLARRQTGLDGDGRSPTLYIGTTAGALHAFDAASGEEHFVYLPSGLTLPAATATATASSGSAASGQPSPAANPVDQGSPGRTGIPAVADVDWAASNGRKAILVSGKGQAAPGVFTLDVSDPAQFTPAQALWEFGPQDDVRMGHVTGQPQVLRLRIGPSMRWFAAVASTPVDAPGEGAGGAGNAGSPAVFLLALDHDTQQPWIHGMDYYRYDLTPDDALPTVPSGASAWRAAIEGSGIASALYVGDWHGRLWRIELTDLASAETAPAPLPSTRGREVFVATDSEGRRQPIVAPPQLLRGPDNSWIVAFGTGRPPGMATPASGNAHHGFYVLLDPERGDTPSPPPVLGRLDLAQAEPAVSSMPATPSPSTPFVPYPTHADRLAVPPGWQWDRPSAAKPGERIHAGWRFDFESGEGLDQRMAPHGTRVIAHTFQPSAAGPGTSRILDIAPERGEVHLAPSPVGALGPPAVLATGQEQRPGPPGSGRRQVVQHSHLILPGALGETAWALMPVQTTAGRLSWRELTPPSASRNPAR